MGCIRIASAVCVVFTVVFYYGGGVGRGGGCWDGLFGFKGHGVGCLNVG